MYSDQLKQGSYNSYTGGLLFSPFLSHYPFLSTIREILDMPAQEGYSLEELCQTLFYLVFGFRSTEDFKRVYPQEFGLLMGRATSPSHFTLRRFLHKVRTLAKSEELIEAFARMYLKTGLATWGVLYIDAPFLGVDEHFNPWIFLVRSSSEDLLQKIPELIGKVKEAARAAGGR